MALRQALANLAAPPGASFADLGDIVADTGDLDAAQMVMATHLATVLTDHERVVVFGGGHETAFASYCGLREAFPNPRIGILNLDAHLDLRTVGPVGANSGTPFTQIRELDPTGFDYLCLGVAREANTPALFERASAWGVGVVEDHTLIADPHAGDGLIEALIARNDLVYLTICLDVLPHFQAPGVSAPATRGVPFATIEDIVSRVLSSAQSGAKELPLCDIVELCPAHDPAGVTARSAAFLARRLLTQ